jgi:diaminohydroxyphosphoribosylaminopyrimidine deaminase / 5-amino-6-(5-phosphoribosylamino)uracil reductase
MDIKFMQMAIDLADKGKGFVNPNPLVGAVIVKDGKIIGKGFHEKFGCRHAEVNAFLDAAEDVRGADLYVTLEPCSHYGKTPPCALKIIENEIKNVYISQLDPNPLVNSKGVKLLKDAGIHVEYGILEEKTKVQNEVFLKFIQTKKPFVAMKYAMTLDGKIATESRDSKWITNEKSRAFVHELRNQYQAILVGVNTVILDDPMLDTRRNVLSRNPIRIILDPKLEIPMQSRVVQTANKIQTIVYTSIDTNDLRIALLRDLSVIVRVVKSNPNFDLNEVLSDVGSLGIDSVLVEGGSYVHGSFVDQDAIDKVYIFIAPKLIGGKNSLTPVSGKGVEKMSQAHVLKHINVHQFDNDIMIEGYLK